MKTLQNTLIQKQKSTQYIYDLMSADDYYGWTPQEIEKKSEETNENADEANKKIGKHIQQTKDRTSNTLDQDWGTINAGLNGDTPW
jgi:hypothetical protein